LSSQPDCQFGAGEAVQELFSDDSQDIGSLNIQSVQCFDNAGFVNGAAQGSPEDIAQEAQDKAAGDLVPA
jgi:hypothetical protein